MPQITLGIGNAI